MLQLKDLRGRTVGEKVTERDGKQRGEILRLLMLAQDEHASPHAQLEGLSGPSRLWVNGRAWFAGHLPFRPGRNLRSRQDRDLRSPKVRQAGGGIVPN